MEPRSTPRPTDSEIKLRDRLIDFYRDKLDTELRADEATYILVQRFDSFCVAFNKFTDMESDQNREVLLKIADAAIRHCARKQ